MGWFFCIFPMFFVLFLWLKTGHKTKITNSGEHRIERVLVIL